MTDTTLKPDNDYMRSMADSIEELNFSIQKDIKLLRDEKGDLFSRYIAFFRMSHYLMSCEMSIKMFKQIFVAGQGVNHQLLQTKEAKINGWDKTDLENNPFFEQEDSGECEGCEECSIDELIDESTARLENILSMVKKEGRKKNVH